MNQRKDMITGFLMAVGIHAAIAVCAEAVLDLSMDDMLPLFKRGESSVDLTLSPVDIDDWERKILDEDIAITIIQERSEEIVADAEAAEPLAHDADLLEKGVDNVTATMSDLRPRYPYGSRIRGEEGVVTIKAQVDDFGSVLSAQVEESSGHSALDREALRAVRKVTCVTARAVGASVASVVTVVVRFRLTD